ncbi:kelch-like protein 40 [Drosophila rhopaloa]|uniref:Kelch-like protein 40 n=1 Tax=Drosophila rhopaloa TaxID=1041015 RepID=A0A6P4FLE7_DRORH|nr:kelch-like protein 40 [Drosophila rhopaloa]
MSTKLDSVFLDMLENGKFSDCRIEVESATFKCHKIILASVSGYFERVLLTESENLLLSDVKIDTFKKFLQYAYTKSVMDFEKYSSAILMELFECGSKWLVTSMTTICLQLLEKRGESMTHGDLLKLFEFSHKVDSSKLIFASKKNLQSRFAHRLYCFQALRLAPKIFEQYFLATINFLPEVKRFQMIEAYIRMHGDNDEKSNQRSLKDKDDEDIEENVSYYGSEIELKPNNVASKTQSIEKINIELPNSNFVKELLSYIDYSSMKTKDFYEVVGKSSLLTYQEKFENLFLTVKDSSNDDSGEDDE